MSVILHEHPLSPYAQKVKIALLEKGVPFESRLPNVGAGTDMDAFVPVNPRLEVPALEDDGGAIFDSTIILEYIEERRPTPPLLPAAPAARARARMIEDVCDTYYEAVNWAIAEILVFGRAAGSLAERLLGRAREQTAGVNAWLTQQLGAQPWFGGATFGWADLSVVPHVSSAANFGNPPEPGSTLAAWLERVRTRPSVQRVSGEAMASLANFTELPKLVAAGQFKREYRDHRLEWMLLSGGTDVVLDGLAKGTIRFSREIA
jgi:glutathione S-transferase/RNA polymerase-associated protein